MKNKKPFFRMLFCSASLWAIPVISGAAGSAGVGIGFDYSSGDYGETEDTEITYIPVNLKYQNDFYALKLTVPYVSITSSGNVIGGGSNVVVIGPDQEAAVENETQSGLGDIVFSATSFLYKGSEEQPFIPMIDLTGKIKFPTADEDKGLGTGEADYSMESDFTWFAGRTALFSTIGYKFMGSPDTYDLNDVLYGSAGVARRISAVLSGGLMYDVREATTDSGSGTSEATAYVSYRFSDDVKFLLYGVKGFSDGSPDYGIGFTVSYSMDTDEIDWMAPVRRLSDL